MTLLNKYRSLSGQAEDIDSYESHKELIEIIRGLPYKDLFDIMRDTHTALEVLLRGEAEGDTAGIDSLMSDILNLGGAYLQQKKIFRGAVKPRYTFEFLEDQGRTPK